MAVIEEARRSGDDKVRIQQTLKLSPLFDRVSRVTREAAVAAAQVEVVPGGTLVIEQDTVPDALLVLGRVVPLGYRGRGDVLGESCLGRSRRHTENALTMEEAEIVKIPLDSVHEFL